MATARLSRRGEAISAGLRLLARVLPSVLLAAPACGRTLQVGEGAAFHSLTEALAQAAAGDTVMLGPGEYYECAATTVPDLTLQGAGAATVLTDRTCAGKALLIAQGDRLTVRDLVLARARVPDMNGAGIRLEGQGLLLERVRFENDQVGVLAAAGGPGAVTVRDCTFAGGGVGGERPSYALWVGGVSRLLVEGSSFVGTKGGQISSAAQRTELAGNRIATGAEAGAGAAVFVSAGALLMRDNVVAVGPAPPPRNAAVQASGTAAELRGNRLQNSTGRPQALLLDWTSASPVLDGNTVGPGDSVVSSEGLWRHRASLIVHGVLGDARAVAGRTKQLLQGMLGR